MAEHAVATPQPEWQLMMQNLELIHDLMGGTGRMRYAGLRWLPREQAESWEAWQVRLNRSILYNGLSRTIHAMAGHGLNGQFLFQDTDPRLMAICQNIDGQGSSLQQLASHLLQLTIRDGVAHILVDQKKEGGRPYAVVVEAAQMIGQTMGIGHDGVQQVRIKETAVQPISRFEQRKVDQIRVLEKGGYELWQEDEKHQWHAVEKGKMDIDPVPVVSMRLGLPSDGGVRPPLMDLAWLNLAHWQSASDQRHILHIARVPILFARAMGHHDTPLEIGPNRLIMADDPQAEIKFIEHSGAAIAAGRQDLIDLEDKMAVMGLELLSSRPSHPTATGRVIDQVHDRATLHAALDVLKDGLMGILTLMAQWMDLPEGAAGQVILPEAPLAFEQKTREAELLLKARQSGDLEKDDFLKEIERRGLLHP